MTGASIYNADANNRYPCDDAILEDAPENPVRFLSWSELAWKGMVDGIDSLDRLEAYRQAEKRHIDRNSSTAKVDVHKYLDDRERELRGESIAAEPTPEPTPVPTTDGGTVADSPAEPEGSDAEPDDVHPDVRGLSVGEVARINRTDATEYVWPATPVCESPYLLRAFDAEGDERTDGPLALSQDEYRTRMDFDRDTMAVGLIDIDAPRDAATNGGDSQ